jgi:hypothetical protein
MYINNVATQLYRNQLDFNFLDAASLEKGNIENGKLAVGNGSYRVIVIPKLEVMSLGCMRKLSEFAAGGGRVIWLDALPRLATKTEQTAEVRRLAERFQPDVFALSSFKENLASGSTVTASGTDASYHPLNIIDGDTNPDSWKHWSDTVTPAWLELELDGAKTFDYFELHTKRDYELTQFSASFMDLDGHWRVIADLTDNTGTMCRTEFEPVTAKKIRIDMPTGSRAQANIPRVNQVVIGMSKKEEKVKERQFTDIIKDTVKHRISITSGNENFGDIFISPYIKEGKKLYYIVNSNKNDIEVTVTSPGPFDWYDPFTGTITSHDSGASFACRGYMGYFIVERF